MEGGPGHVDGVKGGEVCELQESDTFGIGICGTDLTADLSEDTVDERFGIGGGAEGFDHVVEGTLEERIDQRGEAAGGGGFGSDGGVAGSV